MHGNWHCKATSDTRMTLGCKPEFVVSEAVGNRVVCALSGGFRVGGSHCAMQHSVWSLTANVTDTGCIGICLQLDRQLLLLISSVQQAFRVKGSGSRVQGSLTK
jgi:hypothetical protein